MYLDLPLNENGYCFIKSGSSIMFQHSFLDGDLIVYSIL